MDPKIGGTLVVIGIVAFWIWLLALGIKGSLAQHRQKALAKRGPIVIDQPAPMFVDAAAREQHYEAMRADLATAYKWAGIVTAAPIALAVWIFAISDSGIIVGGILGLIPAAIAGYITRWIWPIVWFAAFAFFVHPFSH